MNNISGDRYYVEVNSSQIMPCLNDANNDITTLTIRHQSHRSRILEDTTYLQTALQTEGLLQRCSGQGPPCQGIRGVAGRWGGGGVAVVTTPALMKTTWDDPPRKKIGYFGIFFLETHNNFAFSTIIKIKWPKSEEKLNFGGSWVWMPI